MRIALDADGRPQEFDCPGVRYLVGATPEAFIVDLGARHPYGKAPENRRLLLSLAADGRLRMAQR